MNENWKNLSFGEKVFFFYIGLGLTVGFVSLILENINFEVIIQPK